MRSTPIANEKDVIRMTQEEYDAIPRTLLGRCIFAQVTDCNGERWLVRESPIPGNVDLFGVDLSAASAKTVRDALNKFIFAAEAGWLGVAADENEEEP